MGIKHDSLSDESNEFTNQSITHIRRDIIKDIKDIIKTDNFMEVCVSVKDN